MTMTKKNYIKSNVEKKKYCTLEVEEKRSIGLVNGSFLRFYASLRRPPSPSDTYRLRADALKIT